MAEPIRENQNAPHGDGECEHQLDTPKRQGPSTVAESKLPPSHPECYKSQKAKRDWFEYVKGVLEVAGLIVLCVYAAFTIKIYHANQQAADAAHDTLVEIQKQTKLSRQQVVGAQQAIVGMSVALGESSQFQIIPEVQGLVPATNIHGDFEVARKAFPSLRVLDRYSFTMDWPIITPGVMPPAGITKENHHSLKHFSENDHAALNNGRQIVFIDFTYRYENGFGDTVTQHFCRYFMYFTDGKGNIQPWGRENCDDFPFWSERFKREHPQAEHGK